VAISLRAARATHRRRELEPCHQPIELGDLVRLERIEPFASQQLLLARRHRDEQFARIALAAIGAPG
jgi:hypothetical protein